MQNTSTEYKEMHNKTISWNDNWIIIFICFVGRLLLEPSASSYSSFIISYPNAKMDKNFFKNWVLQIPHRLRYLLWMVRAWSSHLLFSYYESSFFLCVLFPESAESNDFLLVHIPCMNESHDLGKPFKVDITTFTFSTYSTPTSCYLIWETLVKYDCIVSAFWIFTFFNYFLIFIFWFMLFL